MSIHLITQLISSSFVINHNLIGQWLVVPENLDAGNNKVLKGLVLRFGKWSSDYTANLTWEFSNLQLS